MTSLVALATKDALVLGCDSLGTTTKSIIDPTDLAEFFEEKKDFELKRDKNGNPILKDFKTLYGKIKSLPYTHMTHMSKIFSLSPLEMGILTTGIASIGKRTIKSLIEEFKSKEPAFWKKPKPKNYTVKSIAEKILEFIAKKYEDIYPDEQQRPVLEFILGGYDKQSRIPEIVRIKLPKKEIEDTLKKGGFGIVFGGQMKEIQRIVFGTDLGNKLNIYSRHIQLLRKYRDKMNEYLKKENISLVIPELNIEEMKELDIFSNDWDLDGFSANWGDFSEQNAIECVDFFVNIMIKSQQFSAEMPTVGGEVHIALITKTKGFRFISKEEYSHEGHFVSKEKENE
jgi:5'-3' exonuclease